MPLSEPGARAFFHWMVRQEKAKENPLAKVERARVRDLQIRARRASPAIASLVTEKQGRQNRQGETPSRRNSISWGKVTARRRLRRALSNRLALPWLVAMQNKQNRKLSTAAWRLRGRMWWLGDTAQGAGTKMDLQNDLIEASGNPFSSDALNLGSITFGVCVLRRPVLLVRRDPMMIFDRSLFSARKRCVVAMACLVLGAGRATAAVYYIDSRSGDDARSGLAPAQAWKSLERVNRQVFEPGDQILFQVRHAIRRTA